MPIRELMKRFADDTYGSTLDKVNAAIGSVEKAFAVKAGFFNSNAVAESRFNKIKTANKHYLAHEYFNRMFRKDLFMRGTNRPVVDALSEKPMTLGEICAHPLLAKEPHTNIFQAVTMLMASGQVGPSAARGNNRKSTTRMNQAILERSLYANDIGYMVSPLLRTGVLVPWFIQLLLNAIRQNLKPDDYVWGVLEAQGQRMNKEGKTIEDPEENKVEIRLKIAEFLKTDLPHLKLIGVAQA